MTLVPPPLSRLDLQEELAYIHRKKHRGWDRRDYTTALFGMAADDEVDVVIENQPVRFHVVPVHSELEMRRVLSLRGEEQLALVVDFGDGAAPIDLQAALSGGKIYAVSKPQRLARRLGARIAAPDLMSSPVADALLAESEEKLASAKGPIADLDLAMRVWLHRRAGLDLLDGQLSEERVLAFCAVSDGGSSFATACERVVGLREAVRAWLRAAAGAVAATVFEEWERGEGRKAVALSIVLDAASKHLDHAALRGRLRQLLPALPGAEVLRAWAALAEPVLRRLGPEAAESLLHHADALLPDPDLQDLLAESLRLPSAFSRTKTLLAQAIEGFVARLGTESFTVAAPLVDRLRKHALAQHRAHEAIVKRAVMAARLMAYLVGRPAALAQSEADEAVYAPAIRLAQHHAEQGGYVDFARRMARGGHADPLGAAINALVARVDAQRDADDVRFTQCLQPWIDARRKSDEVLPIETVLDRVAVPFLETAQRRLLVLLLDGMSWENAAELLLDMEEHHVGPLSWKAPAIALRGTLLLPPVIAAFPTVTDVSRSALFAGKAIAPSERDTSKDPERFAQHRGLRKLLGAEEPRLLLRAAVQAEGGHASKQAVALVASEARVVGLVVNAIDEQLKAGQQMNVAYTVAGIKPLRDLLDAADRAGRAILLVADHGHVSGARLQPVPAPGPTSGARWRALAKDEEPQANEVALRGEGVCVPRGKDRVAMLVRETDAFASASHDGEHGGASLAECIAPMLLVGGESLAVQGGRRDAELEQRAFPRPPFWDLITPATAQAARPPPASKKRPTPQMTMFPPVAPPAPPVAAPTGPWVERLTELLKDRPRVLAELVPRIEVLLAADGHQLAPEIFASRAGVLPYRVSGAVAAMQEVMNLDGYEVVEYDPVEQIVRLNRALFAMLFEEATP